MIAIYSIFSDYCITFAKDLLAISGNPAKIKSSCILTLIHCSKPQISFHFKVYLCFNDSTDTLVHYLPAVSTMPSITLLPPTFLSVILSHMPINYTVLATIYNESNLQWAVSLWVWGIKLSHFKIHNNLQLYVSSLY